MKRKLTIFVLLGILTLQLPLHAEKVTVEKAHTVATNFMRLMGAANTSFEDISASTPFTQFYVFQASNGKGFVLVSADDCVMPILGYSTTTSFSFKNMPDNIMGWLQDYEAQIRYFKELESNPIQTQPRNGDNAPTQQWHNLLNNQLPTTPGNTAVAPLLSTTWAQGTYYNSLCPYDTLSSQSTVTGCVATAVAQIMKYWNHPDTGFSSYSYTHSTYGSLSANFGTTAYDWTHMPNQLVSSSTATEVAAVATLIYHAGIAVEMDYNISSNGGSNAYNFRESSYTLPCAENAFRNYFKYRSDLHHIAKDDYADSLWCAILMSELDSSRPILYDGRDSSGGHSFVCDGYNNLGMFHFNWGWNGNCDGYYAMGSLNPVSGGIGSNPTHTFNTTNSAIIGIVPNTDFGTVSNVSVSSNNSSYGSVTGGGTFSVADTSITLTASAAAGCRFVGWSDGLRTNPRIMNVNGGTYNFTANFEPLSGDTLYYCTGRHILNFGSATPSQNYFGIKLPASTLTPGHNLTQVQLYIPKAGTYNLTVYTGTRNPTTSEATQSIVADSTMIDSWYTINLSTPVAIDGTKALWITFRSPNIPFPAPITYGSGTTNALLTGSSFSPSGYEYSLMTRAIFEEPVIPDDTISYCQDNPVVTTVGVGGTMLWGIMFPDSLHSHRNVLTDAMIYIQDTGTYTLNIYQGDSTRENTLLATKTVRFRSITAAEWKTIHLPVPVHLNPTEKLWVTFVNSTNAYPASACTYVGDSNSSLITVVGGRRWRPLSVASHGSVDGSWMIKAILANSSTPAETVSIEGPTVTGTSMPTSYHAVGADSATFTWTIQSDSLVTATGPDITMHWLNPGIYNIVVTANHAGTLCRDTLTVTVNNCAVDSMPFSMSFEVTEDMSCWNIIDHNGDNNNWEYSPFRAEFAHGGSRSIASDSYINHTSISPDNWLVTPLLRLDNGYNYTLTWYDGAADTTSFNQHYSVYISTTGNDVSDFGTAAAYQTTLSQPGFTMRTLNLNAYAGQNIHIAFRHHNTTARAALLIDDIKVSQTPLEYEITVFSADTNKGTVSGGGTYQHGALVTIAANAKAGYHFVQWSDGNSNAVRSFTANESATYTAHFGTGEQNDTIYIYDTTYVERYIPIDHYTLSLISLQPDMGIVVGSGRYTDSTIVEIAAIPVCGNHFLNWSDGNGDNPRHILVTDDIDLSAQFVADSVGIDDIAGSNIIITTDRRTVTVQGVTGQTVRIFDAVGRLLSTTYCPNNSHSFRFSAAGVYLVQVADNPAHRIVIR